MIKALRFKDQYDPKRSLKNWLYGIAHNQFLDAKRKTRRRNEFSFDPEDENLQNLLKCEDNFYSLEEQSRDYIFLIRVIEELFPIRRDAIIQNYFLNRSYKEIAKECNIPIGTVKSRLDYARKDLELRLSV